MSFRFLCVIAQDRLPSHPAAHSEERVSIFSSLPGYLANTHRTDVISKYTPLSHTSTLANSASLSVTTSVSLTGSLSFTCLVLCTHVCACMHRSVIRGRVCCQSVCQPVAWMCLLGDKMKF